MNTASSTHADAVGAGPSEHCPIMPNYGQPVVSFVRGSGTELFDSEGGRYLDFLGGLAVTSLGHSHPRIAAALAEQASTLLHVSNLFATVPQVEVAKRLDALIRSGTGETQPGQVLFQNSGAEANEGAIKLARKYQGRGRHGVLSASRSFHGRTMATLAATGQPEKHEPFQPLPEGFRHATWNDLAAFEAAIDPSIGTILLEPLQGESGVNPADMEFFVGIRRLCDERGILLIVDEVQTGLARTGRWFGFHHHGIKADIVTVAKALGNGVPIGAVWAPVEIASAFKPGDHGSTFGGQPLAAAAACEVLRVMDEIDAPVLATEKGAELTALLSELPGVSGVRGLGLLLAAELNEVALAGRTAAEVALACLHAGLVVNGVTPTSLRFAPPLTVSSAELLEGVGVLASVLDAPTPTDDEAEVGQ
ncbi:MAG TPA: aminotransferase class III-fold pyridoxal phosphate-dependent enzyme [Acidimicrobiales bacterium]|nr:aminotransferase class III-fold pyridoxal phosphate-dependent enzyme [Acidimicrobiales bacterium]